MFRRSTPTPPSPSCDQTSRIEGFVYCAAQNVQRLAHLATNPEDADRILCSLANLEQIARATGSPTEDLNEIESWRIEAERRVESLRTPLTSVHIAPELMEKRRVPA